MTNDSGLTHLKKKHTHLCPVSLFSKELSTFPLSTSTSCCPTHPCILVSTKTLLFKENLWLPNSSERQRFSVCFLHLSEASFIMSISLLPEILVSLDFHAISSLVIPDICDSSFSFAALTSSTYFLSSSVPRGLILHPRCLLLPLGDLNQAHRCNIICALMTPKGASLALLSLSPRRGLR